MTAAEHILGRHLPKWPQMLVTGPPVGEERAKEIIRRTDTFFGGFGGNDREWDETVRSMLRMPQRERDIEIVDAREYLRQVDVWRSRWGLVETEYVHNSWVSCAFIHGPHGWCHPDGTVGYADNIGKWPGGDEVLSDLVALVRAFPSLELGVTLMDGEDGETEKRPVMSFAVAGGRVEVVDPASRDVHARHPKSGPRNLHHSLARIIYQPPSIREHSIPWAWIEEWERMATEMFQEGEANAQEGEEKGREAAR